MAGDARQGRAIFAAMSVMFLALFAVTWWAEQAGNPVINEMVAGGGGNMEGKEARFGIVNSALWGTATTSASNGSVNAMDDSFTPLGGPVPLFDMMTGEVIFGGVGAGFYRMLLYVVLTVFVAGLMVGRMPEFLGKKIEAREVKLAMLAAPGRVGSCRASSVSSSFRISQSQRPSSVSSAERGAATAVLAARFPHVLTQRIDNHDDGQAFRAFHR